MKNNSSEDVVTQAKSLNRKPMTPKEKRVFLRGMASAAGAKAAADMTQDEKEARARAGGHGAARRMTKEQLKARAEKAAAARWAKRSKVLAA